jgi:hypothetical protein
MFNVSCGLKHEYRYIQMSSMILGGMIEADARMRRYEQYMRMQRMVARDRAWRENYERELMEDDEPPSTRPPVSKK